MRFGKTELYLFRIKIDAGLITTQWRDGGILLERAFQLILWDWCGCGGVLYTAVHSHCTLTYIPMIHPPDCPVIGQNILLTVPWLVRPRCLVCGPGGIWPSLAVAVSVRFPV